MSGGYFGSVQPGQTTAIPWSTNSASGASINPSVAGSVAIYKDNTTTSTSAGVTDSRAYDSTVGVHLLSVDTSANTSFYTLGSMYHAILSGATIDGGAVNHSIGSFSVGQVVGQTASALDTAENVALANRALVMLGEQSITSLAQDNKRAKAVNLVFANVRDEILERHYWKSARALAVLTQDNTYTISAASWLADVATIRAIGHDIVVGDSVTIAGVTPTGYNGAYTVTTVGTPTTDDFTYDLDLDSDPGAGTVFGTVLNPLAPAWKFSKQFSLPSDFLRMAFLEDRSMAYEIHGSKFLTDSGAVRMEYTYQLTDLSVMNPALKDAFAAALAVAVSYTLDTSSNKRTQIQAIYDLKLAEARNIDASQRNDDAVTADTWLRGRLSSNTDEPFKRVTP